ncbi:MAG TPA: MFS transporter, partial [Solirubrobacteraceae bacterium]|nr:MFS transporter [Solirubrobacteraceae bacterium]
FRRLTLAYGLNMLAIQVAEIVLALYVYRRTGSAGGATLFFLSTQFVPGLLAPWAVARLDRGRARVLSALYLAEAVLFVVIAGWVSAGWPVIPLLGITLLDGVVALSARSLARAAAVAVTAPRGLLREGNAWNNALFSIAYMTGPALGGLCLLLMSPSVVLLGVSVLFGLIAVVLLTAQDVRLPRPDSSRRRDLRATLTYVRGEPTVMRLLSLRTATIVFFTVSIPVEVVLAQRSLHAGSGGYALLLCAWGTGTVVGSAVYAGARRAAPRPLLISAAVLFAAGFAVMAAAPSFWVAAAGAAIGGTANGIDPVASRTALQETVTEGWQVPIIALNESLWQTIPGVGILLGGALTALDGPRFALAVGAGAALVLAVVTRFALPNLKVSERRSSPRSPAAPAEVQ